MVMPCQLSLSRSFPVPNFNLRKRLYYTLVKPRDTSISSGLPKTPTLQAFSDRVLIYPSDISRQNLAGQTNLWKSSFRSVPATLQTCC